MEQALTDGNEIQTLILIDCGGLRASHLRIIETQALKLKMFKAPGASPHELVKVPKAFQSLTHLYFDENLDNMMTSIIGNCSSLICLRLHFCDGHGLESIGRLPNLTTLVIDNCQGTPESLHSFFTSAQQLSTLKINYHCHHQSYSSIFAPLATVSCR